MIVLCNVQGSEKLWAEHGLTGLVIFALIGIVLVLIKVITSILNEERSERKYTTEKHVEATDKLSKAIDRLSDSFKEKP